MDKSNPPEEFPYLCMCGHQRHAHVRGQEMCRPCRFSGRGVNCEQFTPADLRISINYGSWSHSVLLDPDSVRNARLPWREFLSDRFKQILEELFGTMTHG